MGTWGSRPFDNDTAADLLDTLADLPARGRAARVDRVLRAVDAADDPIDADVATEGLAAAAVVVASVVPGTGLVDPDELDDVAVPVDAARWARAAAVVATLRSAPGELGELWEEAGGADALAGVLQDLADVLAAPFPGVGAGVRLRRWWRARRPREDDGCGDTAQEWQPDVVYVVAGPGSGVFALAAAHDSGWWTYALFPLAPGALPAPAELTLGSAAEESSRSRRFGTDDLPLYDGTVASVEAALSRAPEVPDDLAEWVAETVEVLAIMRTPPASWE